MGNISNRFFVTALEDGTTLHGNLSAEKSLTQGWNGSSAVPDWTQAANQPIIKLTLINGVRYVQPIMASMDDYTWLYNGTAITFDSNNISTNPSGLFQRTTQTITYTENGTEHTITMPALKIIGNLASGSNPDADIITFNGQYNTTNSLSPSPAEVIDFQANIQVRITKITASGYLGVLSFLDGVSDFTSPQQKITIYADFFGGENGGSIAANQFTANWYINGTAYSIGEFPNSSVVTTTRHALVLDERDVTDYATVRCDFVYDGGVKYSAYVGVDDMQDPEFMYIQFNGANGNAASLRKDQSVTFYIWVGKREDPTIDTSYTNFKVKFLDSDGNVITGNMSGIPDAGEGGWRTLPKSNNKAYVTISYLAVSSNGKNLTGIVLAQTS